MALRPTVGQTLLEGISQSQPQPKIPAEMIKYMGRHVHAWHIAISMLEGHVVLFPTDMRCFDALCHLYRSLAEEDMAFGLWHRRAIADDTRVALALRQHGFLTQAQLQFLELMGRGVSGGSQGEQHKRGSGAELHAGGVAGRARHAAAPHHTTTPHHHQPKQRHGSKGSEHPQLLRAPSPPGVTKNEMLLWHQQYLACCAELNQWDTVVEYAKVTDNCPLQIDAMVQLHDWQNLKAVSVGLAEM